MFTDSLSGIIDDFLSLSWLDCCLERTFSRVALFVMKLGLVNITRLTTTPPRILYEWNYFLTD